MAMPLAGPVFYHEKIQKICVWWSPVEMDFRDSFVCGYRLMFNRLNIYFRSSLYNQ